MPARKSRITRRLGATMMEMEIWHLVFVAFLMGASLALLVWADGRRLLHAAVDDRYGELVRFCRARRLGPRLQYSLAFLFSHGLHDLSRLISMLAFDLFVVFALLAPFWRYVFFGDWNPIAAVAAGVLAVALFMTWKLWSGMGLCRLHGWSSENWQCERCGELHARAEDHRLRRAKGAKPALRPEPQKESLAERLSWRRFWEKRLERLNREVEEENPRPAG